MVTKGYRVVDSLTTTTLINQKTITFKKNIFNLFYCVNLVVIKNTNLPALP